jgi:hypothetical protein
MLCARDWINCVDQNGGLIQILCCFASLEFLFVRLCQQVGNTSKQKFPALRAGNLCPGLDSLCVDCYAVTKLMGILFLIYK